MQNEIRLHKEYKENLKTLNQIFRIILAWKEGKIDDSDAIHRIDEVICHE